MGPVGWEATQEMGQVGIGAPNRIKILHDDKDTSFIAQSCVGSQADLESIVINNEFSLKLVFLVTFEWTRQDADLGKGVLPDLE
jgi:hypothetical protein